MKFSEAVISAKKICENEYERRCRERHSFNPRYKREWYLGKRLAIEEDEEIWALKGTPDKAFVLIYRSERMVLGVFNGDKEPYVKFDNLEDDEIHL